MGAGKNKIYCTLKILSAARMKLREKVSCKASQGSSRLRSDIALEVHSYSHVWALKVPLRPSDCHHFTTTHASLAKSCVLGLESALVCM